MIQYNSHVTQPNNSFWQIFYIKFNLFDRKLIRRVILSILGFTRKCLVLYVFGKWILIDIKNGKINTNYKLDAFYCQFLEIPIKCSC